MPLLLHGRLLSRSVTAIAPGCPLLSWWWQTAFARRGSQDALQVTPSVLWKTIENIMSLCPARIQSRLSQQGRVETFLAHVSSVIALLCSTHVLTCMGCWTSTVVHCHSGFFPRNLEDPIPPPDSKLDSDAQKQYANSKLVADSRTKS